MDFTALLKQHSNKHKSKPVQFSSVAGGVQKRRESNIKIRKSTRLTVYDTLRNISITESPVKLNEKQMKLEHRRQQLEKWKQEKEKKKKEEAKNKKKPFVTGVAHSRLKYEPAPPPPCKSQPSTSGYTGGRVTRSQSAKLNVVKKSNDTKYTKRSAETSFAPKNATFKPPEIKNLVKLPVLAPVSMAKHDKKNNLMISFDPVIPKNSQKPNLNKPDPVLPIKKEKQIKGVGQKQKVAEERVKSGRQRNQVIVKSESDNNVNKQIKKPVQSSTSDCDMEQLSASSTEKSPILHMKVTPRRSSQRASKNFTPKNSVPKSESSSEEKLRSPKNEEEAPMTPEQITEEIKNISPCVTLSRGKDNARKEMKKKYVEGLLDEDTSCTESIEHFRRQLNSEITRLTEICNAWDKISEQTILPEAVQELVLAAVGQARLLMSQKLQQFASLIERCAKPEPGLLLVTPADLRGFWDVVFMQVENVDMRFKYLEDLRSRDWIEKKTVVEVKKVNKPQYKKAVKSGGPSRMREMIAAARKAKQQLKQSQDPFDSTSKTFEAGFFSVQSPIRSPKLATPLKPTLLKTVLSSEAKKASASKSSACLAMMRASVIGKSVYDDKQLTPTHLNPINLFATPGRSILKASNVASTQKSGKKSVKVVLFDDSDVEQQNNSCTDTKNNEISNITGIELLDINTDSGMSSGEPKNIIELKENIGSAGRRRSKLRRQDATEDRSPVLTRGRRKSANTPKLDNSIENVKEKNTKRSGRKKVLQELEDNVPDAKIDVVTPKRSSRRRKSVNSLLLLA